MNEMDVGRQLRELRHERDETLEQVSAATGLSVAMLSRIERGERLPSPESVEALARHFGLAPETLLGETIANRMLNRYGRESSNRAAEHVMGLRSGWSGDEAAAPASAPAPRRATGFSRRPISDLVKPMPEDAADALYAPAMRSGSAPEPDAGPEAEMTLACGIEPPMLSARVASFALKAEADLATRLEPDSDAAAQLADATRVAEVALESALRAVERAAASGDPQIAEQARQAVARLRRMLDTGT
jgi:transcriptional regulator with XRE-family HTH domain